MSDSFTSSVIVLILKMLVLIAAAAVTGFGMTLGFMIANSYFSDYIMNL